MEDHSKYYQLDKQIGSGAFAGVSRAFYIPLNAIVAVKSVSNTVLVEKNWVDHFMNEVSISKSCDHPFIIRVYDFFEKKDYYHIVMEHLEGGDMLSFVNAQGGLKEQHAKRFFLQLTLAIEYLHEEVKVVHRDLKLENIMLDRMNNCRLIDFGFSKNLTDGPLSTRCGSPSYSAPELLNKAEYGKEVDIWGLGVILYAMTTGTLPFHDPNLKRQFDKIKTAAPHFHHDMNPDLKNLLENLLKKDPKERITIAEIKKHPWIEKEVWEKIESCIKSSYEAVKTDETIKNFITELQKKKDLPEFQKETMIKIKTRETVISTLFKKEREGNSLTNTRFFISKHKSAPLGKGMMQQQDKGTSEEEKKVEQPSAVVGFSVAKSRLSLRQRLAGTRQPPNLLNQDGMVGSKTKTDSE